MRYLAILSILVALGCSSSSDPTPTPTPEAIKDFDGNEYDTVRIGTQVWLTTDLKTRHFLDGTAVLSYSGYFYAWGAVVNAKKLCPLGYRVPTDTDFNTLTDYLGSLSMVMLRLDPQRIGYYDHGADQVFPNGWGYYWTTTELNPDGAWSWQFGDDVVRAASAKVHGLCVRCIKE